MNTTEIPALRFLRALHYASKAIPTDEASSRFQHLGIIDNKLIGADGERWFAGLLGEEGEVELPAMTIARSSVIEILEDLEYCRKKAKRGSKSFVVQFDADAEEVRILYGADTPIVHHLAVVNLGALPKQWREPVPKDAPLLPGGTADLRCGHMKEAMTWHRSWEEDFGSWSLRGAGGNSPVRVDVTAGGELVATAFLLPIAHPKAQLPLDEPLLEHGQEEAEKKSQSIFDLDWSGDGRPQRGAKTIKCGDVEIDATGLEDVDALLVEGPCKHRDEGPCPQCTEAAVEKARRNQRVEEAFEDEGEASEADTAGDTVKKKKGRKSPKTKQ